MGSAVERLTTLVDVKNPFIIPYTDLLPMQIEAANERHNERVETIKVLANRAGTRKVKSIRDQTDLVPLLFAHTAYKSYPETWLTQGKWDRLGQWLDTISANRVRGVDTKDVKDIDEWLDRLEAAGCYVSCSSGTSGKCSMIPASMQDRVFGKSNLVNTMSWATGIAPNKQYKHFGLTPVASSIKNKDSRAAIADAFAHIERPFSGDIISVGSVSRMVLLRRSIADGTARPEDIAAYEVAAGAREKSLNEALRNTAEAIVANRSEKLLFMGMFFTMFEIAELVRNMGYGARDFNPENTLFAGGGLKGTKLPADYRERIFETLNLQPERICQIYSMQEINTQMPRCKSGRYHVPPWLMLLLLDQSGEELIRPSKGEVEGRAGFFDLSVDGRWGGIISGDKVKVECGQCACGNYGPTVGMDILRYADLPGGDKISCAGTVDAYVRGVS
jgi:hypothetical protein